MLKKQLGKLFDAFRFLKNGIANLASKTHGLYHRPSYKSGLLPLEDFARTVRTLTVDGARTINGSVHFVSLVKLCEFYGDDWPRVEEHVHSVARTAIEARLHRGDIYARYHDDGYLILICNLWREAANTKCRLIARDISRQLFDGGDDDLIPTTEMDEAIKKALMQGDQDPMQDDRDPTAMAWPSMKQGESSRRDQINFFDPDALAKRAERIEVDGPGEEEGLLSGGEWEQESDRDGQREPQWETDNTYINPRVLADLYRNDVGFSYRPVWQIKNRIISSYLCIPIGVTKDGGRLLKESEALSSPMNAAIDFLLLERISSDLEKLLKASRKMVLVVPVHYGTLNVMKNRRLFLDACSRILDEQRQFIVFEVIGLPPILPTATLVSVFSALQPFSRAILVRRQFTDRNLARLKPLGVYAVGIDLSDCDLAERKAIAQMDEFNEQAQKAQLPTYVIGLNTVSLTTAAMSSGFSLIAGEPVMSLLHEPPGILPFKITDLYRAVSISLSCLLLISI